MVMQLLGASFKQISDMLARTLSAVRAQETAPPRRPIDCMELEDRTLLSAAPMPAPPPAAPPQEPVQAAAAPPADAQSQAAPPGDGAEFAGLLPSADASEQLSNNVLLTSTDTGPQPITPTSAGQTTSVVVIDSRVKDSNLLASAVAPDAKVFLYDSEVTTADDVLASVADWAESTGTHIDSLAILSHGKAGQFELGGQWLSLENIDQTRAGWERLGQVLTAGADIDLFGCEIAAPGSEGQLLLDRIAAMSGAEVFASVDITGSGGDWTLEAASLGATPIDGQPSASLDTQVLSTYGWTLAPPVVTTTSTALSYIENAAATAVDPGLTITGGGSAIASATVSISSNYANGQDVLAFTNQLGITGSWNASTGTLTLTGTTSRSNYETALRTVTYANTSNAPSTATRAVTFQVTDNQAKSGSASRNVTVTPVNDAPAGTNNVINMYMNTTYTFTASDFGFTDPLDSPANNFLAMKFVSGSGSGSLTLNGAPVGFGTVISITDINAGKLKYTPTPNTSGNNYASGTFQVQDDGGTANGGVDWDQSPNSIAVNVLINSAPVLLGGGTLTTINEDPATNVGTLVSALLAGKVTDSNVGAQSGMAVTAVDNTNGTWQYTTNGGANWTAFGSPSATASRLLAADANTYVRFVPNANWNGTVASGLTYRAWDQVYGTAGGTANTTTNGGTTSFSSATATAGITVTSVNDAPTGTDKTITINEDTVYTFTAADFGFTDPSDSPANNLLTVRVSTLPGAGSLTNNGVAVTAGQTIVLADITGGKLKFTPAANAAGTSYASFTFQVQDDGGTANGGVNLDPTPNTIAFNVTAVNDPPVNSVPGAQTTVEDTTFQHSGIRSLEFT